MNETTNSKHMADIAANVGQGARKRRGGPSVIATRNEAFTGRNNIHTATEIIVDPDVCRMWSDHDREYSLLDPKNTKDLIKSIGSDGQHIAAVVRRNPDAETDSSYEYEIICGARRHFAVSHLRRTDPKHKELGLKVRVYSIDDEEAFRMSDAENRAREDISDYERAVKYQKALGSFYSSQKQMAQALGESEAWLSLFLKLAKIPSEIVEAFKSIHDLKTYHARQISPFLGESKLKSKLIESAKHVREQQLGSTEGMDGNTVIKLLIDGCKDKRKTTKDTPIKPIVIKDTSGKKLMSYKTKKDGGFTIEVFGNDPNSSDQLLLEIRKLIENSRP